MWNNEDPRLVIEKPYHTRIIICGGANVWMAEVHNGEIMVPLFPVSRRLLGRGELWPWPKMWHWTFPPGRTTTEDVEVSDEERRHSG